MNQIKSIQLGVIAICIATVPLSLAQTPRTRTSGSNQTTITTTAAPRYGGSSGNSTRAPQIGANAVGASEHRSDHEYSSTPRDKRWYPNGDQQSSHWDHPRRYREWCLERQLEGGYTDWNKCRKCHEYRSERERRSTRRDKRGCADWDQ